MNEKYIWIIVSTLFLIMIFFVNRKVRLFAIVNEQIQVFKNAKKKKLSLWDILCFCVFPLIVAIIFVYKLNFIVDDDLANLLTTVYSVIFTVLFGFATIMISKIDSQNKLEKQVAEETFVSIVSSTVLSLIAAIVAIVLTQMDYAPCLRILSTIILALSIMIILLILLITKRTFYLYINHKQ